MSQDDLPPHIPPPPPDDMAPSRATPPIEPVAGPPVAPHSASGFAAPPPAPSPVPQAASAVPTSGEQPRKAWIIFLVVIVALFIWTQSAFITVIGIIIGTKMMKRREPARPSSPPPPPTGSRGKPKAGLFVALGGVIFAFYPLIDVALNPASEDIAREGTDYRPLLMILTIPAGIVIVLIGLGITAWQTRRRR